MSDALAPGEEIENLTLDPGGTGADTFTFDARPGGGNIDRLADFPAADDTIALARTVFTPLAAGNLSSGAFKDLGVADAVTDADDRILYDHTTGILSHDADGSGAAADFLVHA